jgi:HlyD family secretion protein
MIKSLPYPIQSIWQRFTQPAPLFDTDDAAPDVRSGLIVIVVFFVVFLGWAAIARVDSAVSARGTIVVIGNRQEVQHKEGGIVSAIHVKEGDQVINGQVLIDLSGDETEATANAMIAQFIDLKVKEARLLAEQREVASFVTPAELTDIGPQYQPLITSAMHLQTKTLMANRNYMGTQLSVLDKRAQQTQEQIVGYHQQITSNITRQSLTKDELVGVKDLQRKGYAPMTRVRSLEQDIAGLEGDHGALEANVAAAQAQIGETRMQAVSVHKQFLDTVMSDLSDTQSKLSAIEPQMAAARASYNRLHVRATATGKVMGLTATTVGGVIAPGQKLMDIVPAAAPLVIDAMVEAKDGNDIRVGQEAQVRFNSLHERDVPILKGRVLDVSGDTFTDKDNNHTFYTARIEISAQTVATLDRIVQNQKALKPGLPVDVVVPQHKRTVLQYLLEPLNQSLWKTFRES